MAVKAKVYIATSGADYEGFHIIGVFNKPEKALKAIDESTIFGDYVEIQVFEMNGEPVHDDPDAMYRRLRD